MLKWGLLIGKKAAASFDTAIRFDQTCICAIQNKKRLQELMNEI